MPLVSLHNLLTTQFVSIAVNHVAHNIKHPLIDLTFGLKIGFSN